MSYQKTHHGSFDMFLICFFLQMRKRMNEFIIVLICVLLILCIIEVYSSCASLNYCSSHGKCNVFENCDCYEGWGALTDISLYKSINCSTRICPAGPAWAFIATTDAAHRLVECSNQGTCNRKTGQCVCDSRFTGSACQRTKCPNDCSGHGRCKSMRRLSRTNDASAVSRNTSMFYYGTHTSNVSQWDADVIYGCECDSSWRAGIRAHEVQVTEWFGPDCSLRHCPSNDNPYTPGNELDCSNKTMGYSEVLGEDGNLCQVDCADLGICDYNTGVCNCFNGQFGPDCTFSFNANVTFSVEGLTAALHV